MRRLCWPLLAAAVLFGAPAVSVTSAAAEPGTVRAVMNIELQVLDPTVTTSNITRAFAYLVYDNLVSMDSRGAYHPQMLESWKASNDGLSWTFTLRPGLRWHDGSNVTSEDCVASLRRWGKSDGFGKRLAAATREWRVVDAKTFVLELSRPFGFVIEAIGKPNALVPFMLPARLASLETGKPINEVMGSGPFTFRRAEWRPGDKAVFHRNPAYQPRDEPADGMAGGKRAYFDTVELVSIPDPATRVAALQTGAIDYLEILPIDFIDKLRRDPNIVVARQPPTGQIMGGLTVNNTLPPFNDVRIRRAAQMALDQSEILAGMGLPEDMYLPFCQSAFLCDGPYASDAGAERLKAPGAEKARAMLAEAGYKNERIVFLHSTDSALINPISLVVIDQLRRAGFNLDVVASDYSTMAQRRLRREPIEQGGWNMMPVVWGGFDMINPLSNFGAAYSCTNGYPGWPCDPEMPTLVGLFETESDPAKRRALAEDMQRRILEQAPFMFLGQFSPAAAYRANLKGGINNGLHVFWNMRRQGE